MQLINSSTNAPANGAINRNTNNARAAVESSLAFDATGELARPKANTARNEAINPDQKNKQTLANQTSTEQASSNKSQQNFELTDSKLTIIAQQQASNVAFNTKDASFANGGSQSYQERISSQNQTAVSTYSAVNNLAQRESVQKLFGVDLFA